MSTVYGCDLSQVQDTLKISVKSFSKIHTTRQIIRIIKRAFIQMLEIS